MLFDVRSRSRTFTAAVRRLLRPRPALLALAGLAAIGAAQAQTGATGGDQPFGNYQPTVNLTEAVMMTGLFPSQGGSGSASGATIGFIYPFAGNYAPSGSANASGQSVLISMNTALFSVLGVTYGGNGTSTFNLPDLSDRATMGAGTGVGLTARALGASTGSATVTLLTTQIPSHIHSLAGGGSTGATGGGLPFDNVEPSLPLTRLIATTGVFPSTGGGSGSAAFIGQVATFAGNFAPDGWLPADGRLLLIVDYPALFSVIGTQFGGDGVTTFALPDLRGRVSVGADATHPVGTVFGEESTTVTTSTLATHDHSIPGGSVTGFTGAGAPLENRQPSLALNYLIATQGVFASPTSGSFDMSSPIIGQIAEFAGNFVPSGWALADGSLIPIALNTALFSIIGTTYGGNGTTNFALPDLRGRTLAGTGGVDPIGTLKGTDTVTLSVANLPSHVHSLPVPMVTSAAYDASTGVLAVTGSGLLANATGTDIDATKLTLTGEGGATYTLTDTPGVEIASATAFTLTLSATDKAAVNTILNRNGTASTGGTTYNLAAAEDWDSGADPVAVIADLTGNGITVANVAAPAITGATYDAATGALAVTGAGFLQANGAANDVVASKLTLLGAGGLTYTLTDTPNADIASGTAFTLALSATDKAAVALILDKNGAAASDGTVYNLAAAEDWAAGADPAVVVADLSGNGITVSGIAAPVVTFTVTPSAGSNGTIAPATPQSVLSGATASFTVTPSAGYSAAVAGSCGGTLVGNTYTTSPVIANCSVIASFIPIPARTFTGPSPTGSGTISASFTGGGPGCGFATAAFIPLVGAPRSPPAGSAPANVTFPDGLFDFTLAGCTAGSTVTFTITYPQVFPAGTAYWKYGPTSADTSPHWYQLPAGVSGNTVTFSITDGGTGDDDLVPNTEIVDQGGPGVPGGGSGGSAPPTPIPTLSEWALALLAVLLALLAPGAIRRSR
ncbi:MAG TPA: IPTL-CTERM sorting domain-containing protein [Usitatibacter sp.]|nr:IPTL-CTERM sorting domain-containing protein [Usitatibacter sp.]